MTEQRSAARAAGPSGVVIGRVAGAPVTLSWSVLVIAALLAWTLADAQLPSLAAGYSAGEYWAAAAVGVVCFVGSLLAHESGHALTARRFGIPVRSITLWLFGGVARLDPAGAGAEAELRIALAGPAVSGALAAGCGLLAGAAAAAGAADLATATLAWLSLTNAILAGFNLLPAFPLDGGRVYQALQWRRSGSYVDATRKAAALGRVVANGLIALGVVEIALGAAGSGLWMLMIGWFVRAAGRAEADTAEARAVFGDRPVSSIMTPHPVTAPAAISVAELVERYVLGARHSAYPVVDADGAPVGLVTLEHVRRIPVDERARRRVDEAAAPLRAVLVVGPDDSAAELSMLLSRAPGGRALVVAEGRVVGIVTARDVLGAWAAGAGSATGPAGSGPVAADGAPPTSDVSAKLGR